VEETWSVTTSLAAQVAPCPSWVKSDLEPLDLRLVRAGSAEEAVRQALVKDRGDGCSSTRATTRIAALTEPAGVRTFALERLDRIDLRVPRSRGGGAARGAAVGALAGLALGVAVAAAVIPANCAEGENCTFGYALLAIGAATYGAMIGAIVGTFSPGRRWRRVR
jgi:hypothetical protein